MPSSISDHQHHRTTNITITIIAVTGTRWASLDFDHDLKCDMVWAGTLLLSEVLTRLPALKLDTNAIAFLITFYCQRLQVSIAITDTTPPSPSPASPPPAPPAHRHHCHINIVFSNWVWVWHQDWPCVSEVLKGLQAMCTHHPLAPELPIQIITAYISWWSWWRRWWWWSWWRW